MADSCQPFKGQQLKPFRFYSIVFPIALTLLFVETVYIFTSIPATLSSSKLQGFLPKLPKGQ
jgi:hypothetical protein